MTLNAWLFFVVEGLDSKVQRAEMKMKVFLPLVQGMLWTFLLSGWRYWNRGAQFQGASLGSKVRRWWWGVNNWKLPEETQERVSEKVGEVSRSFLKVEDTRQSTRKKVEWLTGLVVLHRSIRGS